MLDRTKTFYFNRHNRKKNKTKDHVEYKLELNIPFTGFYHSYHEDECENALKQMFDYEGCGEPTNEDFYWKAHDLVNWGYVYEQYAQAYAEHFMHMCGFTSFQFRDMTSPREYNFETDRLFGSLYLSEIDKMFQETDKEILEQVIIERHSSRSGFISFYSNDIDEWKVKDVSDWDINELGTLLIAWIMSGKAKNIESNFFDDQSINEYYLVEDFHGNGDLWNWLYASSEKFERIDRINYYLYQRSQRKHKSYFDYAMDNQKPFETTPLGSC